MTVVVVVRISLGVQEFLRRWALHCSLLAHSWRSLAQLTLIYDRNVQDACPITFCLSTHPALDWRVALQGGAVISGQVVARQVN